MLIYSRVGLQTHYCFVFSIIISSYLGSVGAFPILLQAFERIINIIFNIYLTTTLIYTTLTKKRYNIIKLLMQPIIHNTIRICNHSGLMVCYSRISSKYRETFLLVQICNDGRVIHCSDNYVLLKMKKQSTPDSLSNLANHLANSHHN